MVDIILGTGFEESEAIIPCDLLRRAGVEVRFVGIGSRHITGGHGITVEADCTVEEADLAASEMLLLPGGLGGVRSILGSEAVLSAVAEGHRRGNFTAAICAAPTILAKLRITDGKRATCYPGCEVDMGSAEICEAGAVTDGKVITGRAAGTAFDFGLALITALRGEETARRIAAQVVYG